MLIRRAETGDMRKISEIITRNFDEVISKIHSEEIVKKYKDYYSIDSIIRQMAWKKFYVIEEMSEIIGTGSFANFGTPEEPKYVFSNLSVAPEYHSKGVGKLMINKLISDAKESRVPEVFALATRDAIHFYAKMGFIEDIDQPDKKDEMTWMKLEL